MRFGTVCRHHATIRPTESGSRLVAGRGGRFGGMIAAVVLLSAAAGCSRRPPPSPPIDWAEEAAPRGRPAREVRAAAPADMSASRKVPEPPPPAATSGAVPAGAREASANGGGAAGLASTGSGAGDASGNGGPSPGRGGEASGRADGGPADPADKAGAEDKPGAPAPALPGRGPRRPARSAEQAAEFAQSNLGRARTALRGGDVENATQLALAAYDAVAPHAAANRQCGGLCADAGKFLESVARQQGPAADQPTRFE